MGVSVLAAALLEWRYPRMDPVALDLPGPIDVRWYGLGYLIAFAAGYYIFRYLAREGFLPLDQEAVSDLIFALIIGTILGGRIGYILFYSFPQFSDNPLRIFRIWEGGLSFHGGLLGVVIGAWWFARTHGVTLLQLGDAISLGVPFGIVAVRLANFINGELFGRVAGPDVPWAMRFPTDPIALRLLGADGLAMRGREQAIERAYESGLWASIQDQVPLRHPSQLYEAALEGVLLGLIVWAIYAWARNREIRLPAGTYGAAFLLGYGIFRSIVELFRQPDAQFRSPDDPLGTVLGPLTMGQTLSMIMVIIGVTLLTRSWIKGAEPNPRRPTPPAPARRK
jgi:phosphatidylglycerol:prolipoprotein diacylglycerol transferase